MRKAAGAADALRHTEDHHTMQTTYLPLPLNVSEKQMRITTRHGHHQAADKGRCDLNSMHSSGHRRKRPEYQTANKTIHIYQYVPVEARICGAYATEAGPPISAISRT